MPEAVFEVEGDTAVPTVYAQGPWDPNGMHGGALAALLVHVFNRSPEVHGMHMARLAVDFLRPVALERLDLATSVVRSGGRLHLAEIYASQDGRPVARANATWLRVAEVPVPEGWDGAAPVPGHPDDHDRWYGQGLGKFTEIFDFRTVEGDYYTPGPGAGWLRPTIPIVAGHPNSPSMVVAASADFGHGMSAIAPVERLIFVNPDLTVTFAREPAGEWVFMRARTFPTANGHGAAESEIYDLSGRVGRSVQTLFFDTPRARSA